MPQSKLYLIFKIFQKAVHFKISLFNFYVLWQKNTCLVRRSTVSIKQYVPRDYILNSRVSSILIHQNPKYAKLDFMLIY